MPKEGSPAEVGGSTCRRGGHGQAFPFILAVDFIMAALSMGGVRFLTSYAQEGGVSGAIGGQPDLKPSRHFKVCGRVV